MLVPPSNVAPAVVVVVVLVADGIVLNCVVAVAVVVAAIVNDAGVVADAADAVAVAVAIVEANAVGYYENDAVVLDDDGLL